MQTPSLRSARDYNRALPAPIRWGHWGAALVSRAVAPLIRGRETWAAPLLVALPFLLLFLPLDGPIARFCERHPLGGDARRELEALQQYGQGVSTLLIGLVIWLQDPPRRRALLNWVAALIVAFVVVFALKTLLGRPRPDYDEPWQFLSPLGQYPVGKDRGVHHAWEIWSAGSYALCSMPSSHTAYAFVMAVFIGSVYPRLRTLAFCVATVVGVGRVLVHAHYPTDVIAGAALGLAVGRTAVAHRWGMRLPGTPASPDADAPQTE